MDSQDYLDQISRSARPVKPKKGGIGGILSSKWFKWGLVAMGLFVAMVIFGALMGNKVTLEERCTDLKLRLDGTTEAISEYQGNIKSSLLRSLAASLKGVFSNTSSQLESYMIQEYDWKENKVAKDVIGAAEETRDGLMNELFEAKINGLLDRTFAHKMALEIYEVMADETGLKKDSNDSEFQSFISTSYDSLNNLYTQFNDFSETNNK